MALKENILEAVPCLLKQSSKTKIIVNLVPNDFQLPHGNESSQLCSGQKVDGQQCRHKVADLKFMPKTKQRSYLGFCIQKSHLHRGNSSEI